MPCVRERVLPSREAIHQSRRAVTPGRSPFSRRAARKRRSPDAIHSSCGSSRITGSASRPRRGRSPRRARSRTRRGRGAARCRGSRRTRRTPPRPPVGRPAERVLEDVSRQRPVRLEKASADPKDLDRESPGRREPQRLVGARRVDADLPAVGDRPPARRELPRVSVVVGDDLGRAGGASIAEQPALLSL